MSKDIQNNKVSNFVKSETPKNDALRMVTSGNADSQS